MGRAGRICTLHTALCKLHIECTSPAPAGLAQRVCKKLDSWNEVVGPGLDRLDSQMCFCLKLDQLEREYWS